MVFRLRRRRFLSRRAVLSAALMASVVLSHAHAETTSSPAEPVDELDQALLTIMKAGKSKPFDARMQILAPVIQRSFDLPQILASSIGPRYVNFSPDQQSDLLTTFTQFTTASYVANFDSFSGERFEVSPDTRKAGSEDVVQTRIIPTFGDPARLDYVVRAKDGSFKITDVLLDGSISRVAVQRSDFRSLLTGGDPAPLIAMLRTKVAGLSAGKKE